MRREHAHRDLWLGAGLALLALAGGTPTAVWGVEVAAPTGRVSLWPNPFIIASMAVFVVAVYILLSLLFSWPLPGGFVGSQGELQGPSPRRDARPAPMMPPVPYQVQQLRQVIRKVSETTDQIDGSVLRSLLANMARTDVDPAYEPLHAVSVQEGLAKLAEQGVLEHTGPTTLNYRILPDTARRRRFSRRTEG